MAGDVGEGSHPCLNPTLALYSLQYPCEHYCVIVVLTEVGDLNP